MNLIGHRGAAGEAPENTLAAIERAFKAGANGVELDVQRSRDGSLLLFHDETLERTTDGMGPFEAHDFQALRRLDAGEWFGGAFRGERMPTLAEALDLGRNRGRMILELKSPGRYPGIAAQTVALLQANELLETTELHSFDLATLVEAHRLEPRLRIKQIVHHTKAEPLFCQSVEYSDLLKANRPLSNEETYAWTVNSIEDAGALRQLGVSAIISDFPTQMASWLRGFAATAVGKDKAP